MSISIRYTFSKVAKRIAGSRPGRRLIAWVFSNMHFVIPKHRIVETESLVAFFHPQPAYKLHIVLVPKRSIASLLELGPDGGLFLQDVFDCTKELVRRHELDEPGYRLVVNGGANQDFPYLHFHLISGPSKMNNAVDE